LRRERISARNLLRITVPYLLTWLAFMVVPTIAGQPEVICATPFGLILALVAGTGVVVWRGRFSNSIATAPVTWLEGILAGTLVGAFQGLLFGIWIPVVMAMHEARGLAEPTQGEDTLLLTLFFIPVGTVVGALLGAMLGAAGRGLRAIGDRRRARKSAPTNYP
jgi:hypothetical protein